MYLLYADESGDLSDPNTKVFVVAAVAVHEDAVRPAAGEINKILNSFVGVGRGMQVEIHGNPLRVGAGEWKSISSGKRHSLARELLDMVNGWEHPDSKSKIEPFAIVMDRDHSQSPTETTYGELLYLFDRFLRGHRKLGDPHNGVLIADRSRYERTLEAWVEVARARTAKSGARRLYALAETPFFVDSRLTRLMQLGDLVAHALFRAYNAGDWAWANTVMPTLTEAHPQRVIHFTSDEKCSCPACAAMPKPAKKRAPSKTKARRGR